jgi:putative NADH-flavin reductase
MHVLVVGGTGRIGGKVVEQALEEGHKVTVLARRPAAAERPGVTVLAADVLEPGALDGRLPAADVVVYLAGTRGTGPSVVRSDGMANLLAALAETPTGRVVAVAPAGVAISRRLPMVRRLRLRFLTQKRQRNVLNDAERMEDELRHGTVDWTVVRCTNVREQPATGRYQVSAGGQENGHRPVAVGDLAAYLLSGALAPELSRSIVTVSGQR